MEDAKLLSLHKKLKESAPKGRKVRINISLVLFP